MSSTTLVFSAVTFGFAKGKPLFDSLSCSLANDADVGKIIALMGPSGVGKTSFCELALGIRRPDKGLVEFVPETANIAVIPQKGVIFEELSVRENITCLQYSNSLGATFHEDKVRKTVESLGLSGILQRGTRANALSGGEAQRVMLARTQTVDCDVLILDEPCSFLDNRVKDSFLKALRATVNKSRLLALMVTHVWDEALQAADEVLFFHQASGKAVTLHRNTIAEAQQAPPTIDALFAIYWPDCGLYDLMENPALPSLLKTEHVPHGARFLGLFKHCFLKRMPYGSPGALRREEVRSAKQGLKGDLSEVTRDASSSWAFYDVNGLLLKTSGPQK